MKRIVLLYIVFLFFCGTACKKYLEATPDKSLVVPNSLSDLRALLDDSYRMNNYFPAAGAVQSDDYYVPVEFIANLTTNDIALYTWQKTELTDDTYNPLYQFGIYNANTVLEYVDKVDRESGEDELFNWVKGSGYYYRAFYLHTAAQLFAKPYKPGSAAQQDGVVARVTADINVKSVRSSLQQNYDQIIGDLHRAEALLPTAILPKTRPSKLAVYGMLAKVYLAMSNHDSAGYYANKYLGLKNGLIDYNTLDPLSPAPITIFNEEVAFHAQSTSNISLVFSAIDSMLYRSYEENDLRKQLFFESSGGNLMFKGSYVGNPIYYGQIFAGVATDEMYLIRAESLARDSNLTGSLKDLNTLLEKRYKAGTFTEVKANTAFDALKLVLMERRKEMPFRDTRWIDLRRFNNEPAFQHTLVRKVNSQEFKLEPNSNRYALLLPIPVIQRSGVKQND